MSKIIQMSECVESGEYSATFIFLVMNTFHPGPEICLGSDSHEIGKSTDIAFTEKFFPLQAILIDDIFSVKIV